MDHERLGGLELLRLLEFLFDRRAAIVLTVTVPIGNLQPAIGVHPTAR